jgi:hypothetical protein
MPAISRPTQAEYQQTVPYQRRNTARRSQPLPPRTHLIKEQISRAIVHRHNNNQRVHTDITGSRLTPSDIVYCTRQNMEVFRRFYNTSQHQSHYQLGYALEQIREAQELSDTVAAQTLELTDTEARRARKTFFLFRLWPSAIHQLGDLPARDIVHLTMRQLEDIRTEMISRHETDPTDFLPDFPGEQQEQQEQQVPVQLDLDI